jgi:hypothetical protein
MIKFELAEVKKALEDTKARSAWDKGVKEYALEIADTIDEAVKECGSVWNLKQMEEYALNGARNWHEYSWGGCSLIYDSDIAERLCTASELKRTSHGEKQPNSREEWLDVQARALSQAFNMIVRVLQ